MFRGDGVACWKVRRESVPGEEDGVRRREMQEDEKDGVAGRVWVMK